MKVVTFNAQIQLHIGYLSEFGNFVAAGENYVFFDEHVKQMRENPKLKDRFFERELPDTIRLYRGENLDEKSLLFTSLGGYGDALCYVQALNTLQSKYLTASIDLAVNLDSYFFVKQFGFKGGWINYPIKLKHLQSYDYFQPSESLRDLKGFVYNRDNVAKMFSHLFSVPLDLSHSTFNPDQIARAAMLDFSDKIQVGIQVDAASGNMRSYPSWQVKELAELLSENDFEVYLFGFHNTLDRFYGRSNVHNLVNKLSTVLDLTTLVSQMDAIIAPDSVGGHLGGMLNVPTIVLFSVTDRKKMDHYNCVYGMQSRLRCSPCFQLYECPLGYSECTALTDESMNPRIILDKLYEVMSNS